MFDRKSHRVELEGRFTLLAEDGSVIVPTGLYRFAGALENLPEGSPLVIVKELYDRGVSEARFEREHAVAQQIIDLEFEDGFGRISQSGADRVHTVWVEVLKALVD